MKVELALWRRFFDAGFSEVQLEAPRRVLRHKEKGGGRDVDTFAAVLFIQFCCGLLSAVGVQVVKKPVGQWLQTLSAPFCPVSHEPDAAVFHVEMGEGKLPAFVCPQAAEESHFIQDALVR